MKSSPTKTVEVSKLLTYADSTFNFPPRIQIILSGDGKFSVVGMLIIYIESPIETDYNNL